MPRINELNLSNIELFMLMTDGNPGAMKVLMEIADKADDIDPDNSLGAMGVILTLDGFGIYGSQIWMLYKDVCKQNLNTVLALLRAVQLGYLPVDELIKGISDYGEGIDVPEMLKKVKQFLPRFVL